MIDTNVFSTSEEVSSTCSNSSSEWQQFRESSYSTIAELKQMKLSVFQEKLNLYHENCRMKDDIIRTLQTCLETYKNTNLYNNELILALKSKLSERRSNCLAMKKSYENRLKEQEKVIQEKNHQIAKHENTILEKGSRIIQLDTKLAEQFKINFKQSQDYENQILDLQTTAKEKDQELNDLKSVLQDKENHILSMNMRVEDKTTKLEATQENTESIQIQFDSKTSSNKDADLKIVSKHSRKHKKLSDQTIKKLQESLIAQNGTEIEEVSLPRVGSLKILSQKSFEGSNWIVIQRRIANRESFNQSWYLYVDGFGDLDEDFWLGLDNIHALLKGQTFELYVHLVSQDNKVHYAYYDNFAIGGKYTDYRLLSLGQYSGDAGDGLRSHENNVFRSISYDAAMGVEYSRWWHNNNSNCNLNGSFDQENEFGVWWSRSNESYIFLKSVQMMIRPKQKS